MISFFYHNSHILTTLINCALIYNLYDNILTVKRDLNFLQYKIEQTNIKVYNISRK